MYYTCNPGGVGHAWVKRLFIDRRYRGSERSEDYVFIPARVTDNPVLMRDKSYVITLENLPEPLRRAHLDGDWDVLAGQYFSEFSRGRTVTEPFEIPKSWRRFAHGLGDITPARCVVCRFAQVGCMRIANIMSVRCSPARQHGASVR
jgi:hypothetical protein